LHCCEQRDQTREALAHLEQGRTKAGKVVIRMK
jgi:hypothetical protein